MKEEKGITLLSLIIYVIVLTLVTAMLATISNMFFSNTKYITENGKYISEFNKFNMYFIEDVKKNKTIDTITNNEIIFEDGTTYTYQGGEDNSIYRNKVKICTNISYCEFTKEEKEEATITKTIIKVNMIVDSSKLFEVSNEYVLKY